MQDIDSEDITAAVLAQMSATPDPRLREVMAAAVRHLHAFAREVRLTPDEWLAGIAFLTAVGQTCTPYRQEMILLSDVLGLSRLVDVMHDAARQGGAGTETSLLGPFFRESAPEIPLGGCLARAPGGPEIVLFGQVLGAEGEPLPGARIDFWQANADGLYDLQAHDPSVTDMRGWLRCDAEGRFHVRTVRPIGYSIPTDGPVGGLIARQGRHGFRPAHIHVLIAAPGHRELVTALYFADDAHVDSDTVFGVSRSLVVSPELGAEGSPRPDLPGIRYDFRLTRATDGGAARVGADPSRMATVSADHMA